MNQEKKISVCIPFYNIESYVSRCLDSVLGNTYQNLEVICVNDGSSDGTSALLHTYEEKDPRVIVIDKKNGGIVSARNSAIDAATGDFISFIDGDDWIHHQFFEVLMSVQKQTFADAVICGYEKCTDIVKDIEISKEEDSELADTAALLNNAHARTHIWGRIYAKELVSKQAGASDIVMGEDTAFNLLFLCRNDQRRVVIIPERLYYYFQREDSVVHTTSHAEKIKVSLFFKKHFCVFSGQEGKKLALYEIIRTMLTYRYLKMYEPDQTEIHMCCKELYAFCTDSWRNVLPKKERAKYMILYYCPIFYRLFRIVTDPTMLDWERAERKRQRQG